jgi:hypothetical protein
MCPINCTAELLLINPDNDDQGNRELMQKVVAGIRNFINC